MDAYILSYCRRNEDIMRELRLGQVTIYVIIWKKLERMH
jgi:hypothetical protein